MKYVLDGRFFEISTCEEERSSFTSVHALMRVMQRRNLTEKQSLRLIQNAWENGDLIQDLATRKQRTYVERHMTLMYNGWTQLRIYQDFLFIFAPNAKLITAYPLPTNFYKRPHFDQDKHYVRNFRKYNRMHPVAAV